MAEITHKKKCYLNTCRCSRATYRATVAQRWRSIREVVSSILADDHPGCFFPGFILSHSRQMPGWHPST